MGMSHGYGDARDKKEMIELIRRTYDELGYVGGRCRDHPQGTQGLSADCCAERVLDVLAVA